ncbi:MAG: HepT-like ribonuclease domain-containing protein [Actinomycetes bacterium]
MTRNQARRLGDILERIEAAKDAELILVQAERSGSGQLFNTAYDAILYDLLVIGEAVKFLDQGFREAHPEVPWTSITGMRDILAHEYFRVSADVVRQTLDQPLDRLELACRSGAG